MLFLADKDRDLLLDRFRAELKSSVQVLVFSESDHAPSSDKRACLTCADAEELMKEVAGLSDLIQLEIVDAERNPALAASWEVALTPTIGLRQDGETRVRFLGLPLGFEFVSFVETLLSFSSSPTYGLSDETLGKIEAVREPLEIKIFSTPT